MPDDITDLALAPEPLADLEAKIEAHLMGLDLKLKALGAVLVEIRDRRLYAPRHATFEDYCQQRWQRGRGTINRWIAAAVPPALDRTQTTGRNGSRQVQKVIHTDPSSDAAIQPPLEPQPVIVNADFHPAEPVDSRADPEAVRQPEASKPVPPPAPPRPQPGPPPEPAQAPTAALPAVLDHPDCPTCARLRQEVETLDRRLAIHRAYHGGPAPTFLNGRTEEAVEEIDLDDAPPLPRDDPMAFPRRSTGFLSKAEQTASRRRGPRA